MNKRFFLIVICFLFGINSMVLGQSLDWIALGEAQEKAAQTGKKVFIFAEAEWCGYCKKMKKQVFPQPEVQENIKKYFHPVKVDIESNEKIKFDDQMVSQRNFAQKFRIQSTPTMIFIDSDGKILGTQPGFMRAEIFDKLLSYIGAEYYKEMGIKAYLKEQGVSIEK
ncbi:thioredoxin family protein [Fodinibius halophilus]|uniref:Thioredoxin fold domain-containing protein n=1 Tax=Fodinibius halophilus TaxID=1736908 RepID=A0A6M1T9U7_9BACT|nr:thioredoxin fold domain-containing protein [Fodinibius halophilus]NGP87714.1 thioredoxin fold domain-containing protein [Fodinibius halophilus]